MAEAIFNASMRLRADARPSAAMSNAVPWSGEVRTNGKPQGDVDAFVEAEGLQRDQRLVVIHRDDRVIAAPRRGVEQRVGRIGPVTDSPSARRSAIAGAIVSISSLPMVPSSPACGLSPATAMRGLAMPKSRSGRSRRFSNTADLSIARGKRPHHVDQRNMNSERHHPEASLTSIITARRPRAPRAGPEIRCGPESQSRRGPKSPC